MNSSIVNRHSTLLELVDVSAGYQDREILHGVSLKVAAGSCVGILGPNGSGKTTLLRVMAGALVPTAGRVEWGGRPLGEWTPQERARHIAVVHQEHETVMPVRVGEAVLTGRTPHLSQLGWESEEDVRQADRAMEEMQVTAFRDRWLHTLSSGERQRVWLAMAMAQRPQMLFLDEPTAHLDIQIQMEVMDRAVKLRESGGAVVWVSHDVNLAARYCTHLLVLAEGRVAAEGRPEEVLTPKVIHRVFGSRLRVETARDGRPMIVPMVEGPG